MQSILQQLPFVQLKQPQQWVRLQFSHLNNIPVVWGIDECSGEKLWRKLILELELPELLKKQLHTEMLDCWTGAWYLKPEAKQNLAFTNKDKSHAWKVKYFDETED